MTLIKICGITNIPDARAAVEAGADAVGFNFYPLSPRYVRPEEARAIIDELPSAILTVGVFVNEESPQQVLIIAKAAGVSALQLHGDESPEFCAALTPHFVIKVFSATSDFAEEDIQKYNVPAVMLDAGNKKIRGGTGQTIDWSIATRVRKIVPRLFLAGGLSPENIAEAIETVNPYAVDACSLLEHSPREKNHELMRSFIERARSVKPVVS